MVSYNTNECLVDRDDVGVDGVTSRERVESACGGKCDFAELLSGGRVEVVTLRRVHVVWVVESDVLRKIVQTVVVAANISPSQVTVRQ